jgi:hypothetical protein
MSCRNVKLFAPMIDLVKIYSNEVERVGTEASGKVEMIALGLIQTGLFVYTALDQRSELLAARDFSGLEK